MTTHAIVENFLAARSAERRLDATSPGQAVDEWRAFAIELGVPCPEALVLLARTERTIVIEVTDDAVDNHDFQLLSPDKLTAIAIRRRTTSVT